MKITFILPIFVILLSYGIHESLADENSENALSIKQQLRNNVLPADIVCKKDLKLVFKSTNETPACVKLASMVKLYERNWLSKHPHDLDYNVLAEEASRQFIVSSPTFKFDGIKETLKIGYYAVRESLPPHVSIAVTFSSANEGYGDRTNQILTDSITNHTMTILVEGGTEIRSAIIDKVWDELNQTRID